MCLVIKYKPAVPEYKEIQIVLDSTPVVEQPVEEQSVSAEQQSAVAEPVESQAPELPNPVETPVAAAKVEAPKKAPAPAKPKAETQPKTQTTTKTTDPSKKVDFDNLQYATDYSDFDFNNVSSNTKTNTQKNWDDYFTDDNTTTNNQTAAPQKVNTSSSMQGSSGTKTTETTQSQKSPSNNTATYPSSSGDYDDQFKSIRDATGSSNGNPMSSNSLNQQFSSDLDMTWKGGARKSKGALKINLDDYGSYIEEAEIIVQIDFTVDEKGYVITGSITITPATRLKEKVRQAVISQISQWRFSEDSTRSTATFEYTIEKTIQ